MEPIERLRETLVQQVQQLAVQTWLQRIDILTHWLVEMECPKKRSAQVLDDTQPKDVPTLAEREEIPLMVRDGQRRVKEECFRLLRDCDRIKILVNLQFPKTSSTALTALEEVLSELSQAQTACTTMRASVPQYALKRAKIATGGALTPAVALALTEMDEEALFLVFHHLAQLRNIYVVLCTLLERHRLILGVG